MTRTSHSLNALTKGRRMIPADWFRMQIHACYDCDLWCGKAPTLLRTISGIKTYFPLELCYPWGIMLAWICYDKTLE
ncbi:MAG TPA: hypothetical protein VH500_00615 [Nitrososphaeraceae archaeon]